MQIEIKHIFCGKEEEIDDGKRKIYKSSYRKQLLLVDEKYTINELGFEKDTQSDKKNHGGVDKAVCVYSQKYYEFFKKEYNFELGKCSFGENFTILDFDDSEICLGDKFQCADVIFEVSQPRQPCWKISSIIGIKDFTSLVVKEYKTGFYLRVLNGGEISYGEPLKLISREYPELTIEFINRCAFNAKDNQEGIKKILSCDKLADAYRESLTRRYKFKETGIQDFQKDNS